MSQADTDFRLLFSKVLLDIGTLDAHKDALDELWNQMGPEEQAAVEGLVHSAVARSAAKKGLGPIFEAMTASEQEVVVILVARAKARTQETP